jgi:hypothetical protein
MDIFQLIQPDFSKLFELKSLYFKKQKFQVGDSVEMNAKLVDLKKDESGQYVIVSLKGNLYDTIHEVVLEEKKTKLTYTVKIN